jgi:hypothetical protein
VELLACPIDACAFFLVARLLLARRSHPDLLRLAHHDRGDPGRAALWEDYVPASAVDKRVDDPDVGGHG